MNTIKIYKSQRLLEFWKDKNLESKVAISLGFSPEGQKLRDGDGRTPEGKYYICTKNAASKFTLFLGISYPNVEDGQRGLEEGVISQEEFESIKASIEKQKRPSWETSLGGKIGIHGMGNSRDWTAGCIALNDEDIKWLWEKVNLADGVEIYK